ncbi:glycoside hydrolase family 2 TIM barrel-domain containing protein [Actinacidiphila bryophytorum]|uniref:Beta-galactosidase n=1 Tax=Actinacidiphila bryophytorum TaxID=1436133 RepID=A0A9W4H411_9ACTN|nr:glycoside hydrolase family 2 TIM barrel-domain containing protein [Actinacidiphila bryophytorum]MBM9435830.1 glycoside hydrolase family 2 protein [Actinacidiphila bryophytorum]MBN6543217.1 glycoside hydrolase family 2 protein [Actinacidiphila bryophytorum]CAG7650021.1 Beta-galactosidase [Actinacidiphila bryophytorum]
MPVNRRSLLVTGAVGAAVPALPGLVPSAAAAPAHGAGPDPAHGRTPARTVDLSDGWRFALVNPAGVTDPTGAYADAAAPGYDDSRWRAVSVPHDWSIEQTPTTDSGTSGGTGFLPGGLGWYRTSFTLPPATAGRRVSVEFDGVYMDSYVYCNGTLVGNHPYGYTGFAFDLTDLLHTDGRTPNVIAVQVRNQLPSSRWYSGSGIYRNARLVITDPVHLARWGTFVTTPGLAESAAAGHATVRAEITAVNESAQPRRATVVATVRDPQGRQVARQSAPLDLAAGGQGTETLEMTVAAPKLWSLEAPHLYSLEAEVQAGGRTLDSLPTTFGFRFVAIDPDTGMTVNGVHAKIQGVDLHHDQGALGSAISADALLRQMTIMKSMGVNAFRTSHNPPSPEMIRVCEQLGIVMMVEAFDCWHTGKTTYDYHRFFDANSAADIAEMVKAARNSPAVVMWSIGNEIPDSTSTAGLAMAQGLIDTVRSLDTTRPVVIGSDKYRGLPAVGSAADLMLGKLDGLGLNYNTAASVDALHARYPHLFLFESESSSETSTRGAYQEPQHLNTGENYTPGRRETSSYDNNLASWTISGEYGLKKDRDRRFFAGQFLWSGMDYIGEPTPYNVFPVKASFFGAVDTAGFPKDMYHLFRSQWTAEPMVHLVPMDWTDHKAGETVEVWAYSNVDTVELFLDGRSLGVRRFDTKTTTDGRTYLETTEATGDDRTVTGGPYPGSYTSPNGSAGKLHLTWQVPFAPGELKAVARRGGRTVATDVLRTAGAPHTVRLLPDRDGLPADGRSLVYVTAEVIDARGTVVPGADHLLTFTVDGGSLAGVDNGRQESAERYQSSTRTAFHGKALAIVRAGTSAGRLTVTATGPGLHKASVQVRTLHASDAATTPPARFAAGPAPQAPDHPLADASYSGAPNTLPAAMLDGDPATGWSNAFKKSATALLPAFSGARAADWVSVAWAAPRSVESVAVSFTVDAIHTLPAAATVSYWDGDRFVPARDQAVTWAAGSDAPTVITFAPLHTDRIRLDLTSAHPDGADGAQRITAFTVTPQ